jgi:hypothetical protein
LHFAVASGAGLRWISLQEGQELKRQFYGARIAAASSRKANDASELLSLLLKIVTPAKVGMAVPGSMRPFLGLLFGVDGRMI